MRLPFRSLTVTLATAWSLVAAPAAGYDFEVSSRTEAYGYQLRRFDRDGLVLLNRRRLTQYLGLRIFNLLEPGQLASSPSRPGRPPALIYAAGLMRFFSDFGSFAQDETDADSELENDQFELLLGTIEGRNLWTYLDFSFGRQYDAELMDFFAYDGLRLRLNSPWKVFIETSFGAQVNRTVPFSAAVFETDGTSGDGPDDEVLAPAYAVAVGIDDPDLVDLRLAYRHVASRAEAPIDADRQQMRTFWGTDQELLFAHAGLPLQLLGSRLGGAARYNLLTSRFDELRLEWDQHLGRSHHMSFEVLRSRPHFDGDSIFNVFALEPFGELAGRYTVDLWRGVLLEARGGYRWFWQGQDTVDANGYSAGLLVSWMHPRARADAELFLTDGYGGRNAGGDLGALWHSPRWVFERRITLDGRLSLVHFRDDRPDVDPLLTFGFQLGAQVRLLPELLLHLSLEDNINRIFDSALRLLAVLDMNFAP